MSETPPKRNFRRIAAASAVAIVAVVVLAVTSRPSEEAGPTTTLLAAPETTTTSTFPSTTTTTRVVLSEPPLRSALPEVDGTLFTAITGGPSNIQLVTWPAESARSTSDIPMRTGPLLSFDISGQLIAFQGTEDSEDGDILYVGQARQWERLADGVFDFAWHSTVPGRLAWTEAGRGLCTAAFAIDGTTMSGPECIPDIGGALTGYDDDGFLTTEDEEVVRIDPTGNEVRRVAGSEAAIGPDGRVLIVERLEEFSLFTIAGPLLEDAVTLDWAPRRAIAEYGYVAWSPSAAPELAFLIAGEGGSYRLERWRVLDDGPAVTDGELLDAVDLPGRVWDIEWDSSGRYLLVPGTASSNLGLVHVFDTYTREITALPFDNWVQDTQMVTKSECVEAGRLADVWQGRVLENVEAIDLWMVENRDANVESWWFLSSRLVGGEHDGEIATWALPGYGGEGAPQSAVPANAAATAPDRAVPNLDPESYGVDDWMLLDGARISQWCVEAFG